MIGRRFDDPTVKKDIESWPFKVIDQDGSPMVEVEYLGENKCKYPHHDQRVQERPKHAQRHVAVTDFKILQDETGQQEKIIATPPIRGHGYNSIT